MSPRAVIPDVQTSLGVGTGTLPFMFTGDAEGVLFPISPVWPTLGGMTDAGYSYDHEAEAPVAAFDLLTTPNIIVSTLSKRYRVIDVELNGFLPHIVVRLRRMEATI